MKKIENHQLARQALFEWQQQWQNNLCHNYGLFQHSVKFTLDNNSQDFIVQLDELSQKIVYQLESKVAENDYRLNLPRLDPYDGTGHFSNEIKHHPFYEQVGDGIYGTGMMQKIAEPGKLTEALLLFYLTSHLGEAGHNCPVACTAGVIRVFNQIGDFPHKQEILEKLITPSFQDNYTGAQFVTEVQGGSDVGLNACKATKQKDGTWHINGEKWFCSNANADVILMTARYDDQSHGTKGLGLFLVKRINDDGSPNAIKIRRLKEKIGTRSMASAEIDFENAQAIAMGKPENGFKLLMQNVLHLSRIYNSFAILGAASRAYQIARSYAKYRTAFSSAIENYPLVQEPLADICALNAAMLASALATTKLQDKVDCLESPSEKQQLLLRMRANINKYMTAKHCVENIHHCIDVLAGNGAIETFSPLPRLFRDAIVYENWEGTHNTLRMQILRDVHKYRIDKIYQDDLEQKLSQLAINASDKHKSWITSLKNKLTEQAKYAEKLIQKPQDQQTLMIRDYIDQMASIDMSIHLFAEAIHQQQHENSSTKSDLLEWLLIRFNVLKTEKYSSDWMALMARVVV
jgi:hypothetical protein